MKYETYYLTNIKPIKTGEKKSYELIHFKGKNRNFMLRVTVGGFLNTVVARNGFTATVMGNQGGEQNVTVSVQASASVLTPLFDIKIEELYDMLVVVFIMRQNCHVSLNGQLKFFIEVIADENVQYEVLNDGLYDLI